MKKPCGDSRETMAIENIRRKSGSSLHDPPFCFDPLEPREDDDEDMHLVRFETV